MKNVIHIVRDGDVWAIEFTPELTVSGFPEFGDAAVWLMEYLFRSVGELKTAEMAKQREELRKQILSAAILAPKTEKDKQ